jgi:hypothetical protein
MQLHDLDEDAFSELLKACTRSSLLALSRTSSQFNIVVTPHLLRSVQLDRDPDQIRSFFNFIIFGTRTLPWPGLHVQLLKFCYSAFDPHMTGIYDQTSTSNEFVPMLTRGLALMPNLQSIEIRYRVDGLVSQCPGLVFILMMHPTLRQITLRGVDSFTSQKFEEALSSNGIPISLSTLRISAKGKGIDLFTTEGIGKVFAEARDSLVEVGLRYYNLETFMWPANSQPGDIRIASNSLTRHVVFPPLPLCASRVA